MVKVVLYTPGELAQSSYVHTGFFELEKQKYLKCYVKIRFKKELGTLEILKNKKKYSKRPHPKTSFYDVVIDKNKVIRIAIDLDEDASIHNEHPQFIGILEKMTISPKKRKSNV